MPNAIITGWGKCVPPAVLTNSDLETVTDTSDEWITTRTGIKERRISHVEVSDMSAVAARRALAAAGLEATDIDFIVMATCSPDRLIPSAGTMVQAKIGATNAAAMDLNAACSGFLFGLATAHQMIETGSMRRVLLIGAEKLSYWLDFTNRATSVLFGDGAGAVVLEAVDDGDAGLLAFELGSDGTAGDLLCVPGTGTEGNPLETVAPSILMEGQDVFRRAVTAMGDSSARVIEKAGVALEDVDLLIPHQANVRIIDATARRLSLDPAQVYVNIASYGNTSAATIPIALAEALEEGRIAAGSTIVFAAFGGGFTWAAAVYRWGSRTTPLGASDAELPPSDATALELLQPNIELHGKGV
ncbi:MAG TPA: beta-ketoacyl-ACP synthase III [Acidimicrobiia bacterium]|nr:beta-ketoacyl-ACP synthase III [Acidimicrobiia bacterium]